MADFVFTGEGDGLEDGGDLPELGLFSVGGGFEETVDAGFFFRVGGWVGGCGWVGGWVGGRGWVGEWGTVPV